MPTPNPRIYVTVDPEVDAVLRRLSKATGTSRAGYVRNILRHSLPLFEKLAEAAELAAKKPSEGATALQDVVTEMQIENAQIQLNLQKKKQRKALRKTPVKKKK